MVIERVTARSTIQFDTLFKSKIQITLVPLLPVTYFATLLNYKGFCLKHKTVVLPNKCRSFSMILLAFYGFKISINFIQTTSFIDSHKTVFWREGWN